MKCHCQANIEIKPIYFDGPDVCAYVCMSHYPNHEFHLESGFMALSTATRTQTIDS